jgi:predicted P-loop ATPase
MDDKLKRAEAKVKDIKEDIQKDKKLGKGKKRKKWAKVIKFLRSEYDIRWNVVLNLVESKKVGTNEWKELNDANIYTAVTMAGLDITQSDLKAMLRSDEIIKEFNPIVDYFEALEWDGVKRIEKLASYVHVRGGNDEQKRWAGQFRKALIRTAGCAVDQVFWNKHCLVFAGSGVKQNLGKTSFIRWLAPKALKGTYTFEGTIDPSSKDSEINLAKNFIINLDELASVGRSEINKLKSFMSKEQINVRLAYDSRPTSMPRRASFFGSTNNTDFLTDIANVRWIIFEVDKINFNYDNSSTGEADFNIDDIWAEAYHAWNSDELCQLTAEELEQNEFEADNYKALSIEQDLILRYLRPIHPDLKDDPHVEFLSMSDIVALITKESEGTVQFTSRYIGKELTASGFIKVRITKDGHKQNGYYVKRIIKNEITKEEAPF